MPVREQIGRYKYTLAENIETEYEKIMDELHAEIADVVREGGLLIMPKEYRTIQEVAGPLMLVKGVEDVTYDELGEIELASGETRRCKVLEVDGDNVVGTALRELLPVSICPTVRSVSWEAAWSLAYPKICWDVSSTVWDVRLMTGRKSCRRKE